MTDHERIKTFTIQQLEPAGPYAFGGQYLVHYFWTDKGGRERHEAGQYGDKDAELSEIAECLGAFEEAPRLRSLRPGQSATWKGIYHGAVKQVLVNRIW